MTWPQKIVLIWHCFIRSVYVTLFFSSNCFQQVWFGLVPVCVLKKVRGLGVRDFLERKGTNFKATMKDIDVGTAV